MPSRRHAHADLVGDRGQAERGAERRTRDDVVTAGVTDLGQRVELGAEDDVQVAGALRGAKRGVETGDPALDVEATRLGRERRCAAEDSNST